MTHIVLLLAALIAVSSSQITNNDWTSYKNQYGKAYRSPAHEAARQQAFIDNADYIQQHNDEYAQGLQTFTLGTNQFSDMPHEEYLATVIGGVLSNARRKKRQSGPGTKRSLKSLWTPPPPTSIDWRTYNYVTPVKNEGACGSCWAFAALGALEGQHAKKTGQLVSLSEQFLIDCCGNVSGQVLELGCHGGWMDNAFQCIQMLAGIPSEACYPYLATTNTCNMSCPVAATVTSWTDITATEAALQQAVGTVGPISCGIDASPASFALCSSGVYNDPACNHSVNHAVTVVGYGTMSGLPMWIVKNSWGTSWGSQGYLYLSRGTANRCNLQIMDSYPTV